MILSPKLAVDQGIVSSPERPFDDNQIQQNGIDCRIKSIWQIQNQSTLQVPGHKPETVLMPTSDDGFYLLKPGSAYSVLCHEYVTLPWHLGGEVIIRSTFNRNGVFGRSSWFDPGFTNYVGLTIYPFVFVRVKRHERIGQLILHYGQPASVYDGNYMDAKIKDIQLPDFKMVTPNDLETGE